MVDGVRYSYVVVACYLLPSVDIENAIVIDRFVAVSDPRHATKPMNIAMM